nr:hypothetical protein [Kofleriaceae bacterium]
MKLPRALVQAQRALSLGNDVFHDRGEFEQALALLGFATRAFELFFQVIDRRCPIARAT